MKYVYIFTLVIQLQLQYKLTKRLLITECTRDIKRSYFVRDTWYTKQRRKESKIKRISNPARSFVAKRVVYKSIIGRGVVAKNIRNK